MASETKTIERKKTKESCEEKYRSLFANMLNGFAYCKMIFDKKGKPVDFVYLEVNEAFEKLTGLKKEAVMGKKVTDAIPGIRKAAPELFKIYGRVASTGEGTHFETFFAPLNIWLSISVYRPRKGYFAAVFENITERKKAEEDLKKSEELLRAIMDNAKDAILLKDKTGRVFFANAETLKILDRPIWAVIGRTDMEFFTDPSVGKTIMDADREAIKTKKPVVVEELIPTQYGKRTLLSTKSPWLNEKDEVIGLIVIARDITERKAMEQALNIYSQRLEAVVAQRTAEFVQSNEKLMKEIEEYKRVEAGLKLRAIILDCAREAILLVNLKGDFAYANEAAIEMYGYTSDELLNMNLGQLLRPKDRHLVESRLQTIIEQGHLEVDSLHVRKDKSTIPVRAIHSLIKTEHGQFIVSVMVNKSKGQASTE